MNTQGMNDDELFRLQSYHAGMFAAISEVGDVRRKRTVSDLSERQRAESEVEWYEDVSRVVSAMVARIREAPLGSSHDAADALEYAACDALATAGNLFFDMDDADKLTGAA